MSRNKLGRYVKLFIRLFLVILVVSACSDRTRILVDPNAGEKGAQHKAYVATLRSRTESGWFGNDRADQLDFLDVDVSVPPSHSGGKIRYKHDRLNAEKYFTFVGRTDYANQKEFSLALHRALGRQKSGERDVMVYVHGYNNSFADGVFRTVQLMHDFKLPGIGVHYSWPSAAHPLGYTYDRDSVLFARDGLEQLLREVSEARPDRIILVGHSLGSMLVMETLRQIEIRDPNWSKRHLGGVVLVSPDLDVDVFKQQSKRFTALPQPFIIFVSEKDRALQLSSTINGDKKRLGLLADASVVGELPVTVVDITDFAENSEERHFTLGTSPLLIELLRNSQAVSTTFNWDAGGKTGLLPGTAITVQSATQIILSPLLLQN